MFLHALCLCNTEAISAGTFQTVVGTVVERATEKTDVHHVSLCVDLPGFVNGESQQEKNVMEADRIGYFGAEALREAG